MNRSNQFVFVPFCALAQAFHAKGLVKYEWTGSITPVLDLLRDKGVNIIQMPCLETHFKGLGREPKGKKYYDNVDFKELCQNNAARVAGMILDIKQAGGEVLVLGMEYSPTCAVNVQYPYKREDAEGFFITELKANLTGLDIPFIGINRRGIKPTLERIKNALTKKDTA